jgi:hypothetical protein
VNRIATSKIPSRPQRSLGERSSSHEGADEISVDAPVFNRAVHLDAAKSALSTSLIEIDRDFIKGGDKPHCFIWSLVNAELALTRFNQRFAKERDLVSDALWRPKRAESAADSRIILAVDLAPELGCEFLAGHRCMLST